MSVHDGHQETPPGTLHARSTLGDIEVPPEPGRIVRFGRGGKKAEARVDLRVGAEDLRVSRRHGELTYQRGLWWLRNTGLRQIRLPNRKWLPDRLENTDEPIALEVGHTQVYVMGSPNREYVVELYVFGDVPRKAPPPDAGTISLKQWELDDDERLVLVVMGQRYLRNDPDPRPLTYRETAIELEALYPEKIWGDDWAKKRHELPADKFLERLERKVEGTLEKVRKRLADDDFPYDLRQQKPGPSDDRLKRNLFRGLLESTTLRRPHLALLDGKPDEQSRSVD